MIFNLPENQLLCLKRHTQQLSMKYYGQKNIIIFATVSR